MNSINKILLVLCFIVIASYSFGQVVTFPYTEDFDASADATTTNTPAPGVTSLAKGSGLTGLCAGLDAGSATGYFWIYFSATAGTLYQVIGWEKNAAALAFNVYIGDTKTAAAMLTAGDGTGGTGNNIYSSTTRNGIWAQFSSSNWACPTTGNYYVAFKLDGEATYAKRVDDITISEIICAPSTQATMNAVSGVTTESITVNWTRGDGDNVLVIAKTVAATLTNPTNSNSYTANPAFGSGDEIGTGNFVVYNGAGTSVIITDLDAEITYEFRVYEFADPELCYKVPAVDVTQATDRPTNYYVNDNSTTDDIYCTAIGNNSNYGTRKNNPKLNLTNILASFAGTFQSGDTIFLDVGSFEEQNQSSPVNGVVITGAGIEATTIKRPGAKSSDVYFISIDDNNTVIRDLTISSFDASTASSTGKAIDINGATGVGVVNVQVDVNGTSSGGAWPIEIRNNGTATFDGGGSTCNNTWTSAGGMHISGATANVTIKNYSFIDNFRSVSGAALKITAGTVTIKNSRFELSETGSDQPGSAIDMYGGTVNIYDCVFDGNKHNFATNGVGGAISISSGTFRITRSKIINTSKITSADCYGAGIGVSGGTATIDSCLFSGNVGNRGNDIHCNGATITCTDCTFGSAANQIGINGGSFTIAWCGTPSEYGTITETNTIAPRYTADPSIPTYSGSCATTIILPIELVYFTGKLNNRVVILNWKTASEINNDFFTIERSKNGSYFEPLETIAGAGNSITARNYTAIDANPYLGISYYRLKQTDFDGTSTFSGIVPVFLNDISKDAAYSWYNPETGKLNIILNTEESTKYNLVVCDALGREITKKQLDAEQGTNNFNIDLPLTRSGAVMIVLYNDNNVFRHKSLVIRN